MSENYLLWQGTHDEGNAQCVAERYSGKFAANDSFGWLVNSGTHWDSEGASQYVDRAIVETLKARISAALNSDQSDKYADLIKKSIPNVGKVTGAKALLQSVVYVKPGEFDSNPDLLNAPNGVVDLRTGRLLERQPNMHFMHCIGAEYDPDADQTYWSSWLTEAVGEETADWMQMAVGYTLTGHTRDELMFYMEGKTRSGKGTFLETLQAMLGNTLAKTMDLSVMTAKQDADTQNFKLAPLVSARMVVGSETNVHEKFNEAKLKRLTGGDTIQVAFKHKTPFEYRPQYKIWIASNNPVNADPYDDAVWGRIRLISFRNSYLGREDTQLKHKMRSDAVLRGVLAWAVQGAVRWYGLNGRKLPELERAAAEKAAQRAELDNVQNWINECCKVGEDAMTGDKPTFTPASMLYLSYEKWCSNNGVEPRKMKSFSQILDGKGFVSSREYVEKVGTGEKAQVRGFWGLKL